jgi:hypothetical protein
MHHAVNAPTTVAEALAFLKAAGAPPRVLRHAELVAEVAGQLVDAIASLGASINRQEVLLGAALHDAGKIVCSSELTNPGNSHEAAGEQLLLDRGVPAAIARFCRTHGFAPSAMPALEDIVVAVSDKLWRGVRNQALELALVDAVARERGTDRWAIFTPLDDHFERIASGGDDRLARQRGA